MTKKQLMLKLSAYKVVIAIIAVALLVGGGVAVKAGGFFDWGNVEKGVIDGLLEEAKNQTPEPVEEPIVGALSGPDIPYKYLTVGGLTTYYSSMKANTATTTPCAMQSPIVTSSLAFASARFSVVSSTAATTVSFRKSATAYVTTTALTGDLGVASNVKMDRVLYTASSSDFIFEPSQWVVVGVQGGTGTFSPTGGCNAEWKAVE